MWCSLPERSPSSPCSRCCARRTRTFLAVTALLPLIVLAIVLVRFSRANARAHRLALSRDAIDAMLRASDPRPQMRSLLASVDARMARETIEVAAFGRADRWSRIVQYGPPVPLDLQRLGARVLLDVDHFKSINDLLGHQTGDRALAKIGRTIAENIRGVDVAGRFGGEEFLVLRDASRERTMQVAERLRSAVEASGLTYADGKPVTISIGVAYARPMDGASDVVERADRALYRAKHAGRNRVVESPLVAL